MPKAKQASKRTFDTEPTSHIVIGLYDGARRPCLPTTETLLRVRDGFQKQVYCDSLKASRIRVQVPFHDNLGDLYTVLVTANNSHDVGFFPVKVARATETVIDLMLLPKHAEFRFPEWGRLMNDCPLVCQFIGCGLPEGEAERRYVELRNRRPAALAALMNLTVAMSQIHLQSGTPLDYIRLLNWDESMAQDRFFAYCDPALLDQVRLALTANLFVPEPGPGAFHPGATSSFKQKQFGEANVQLTFHEGDKKKIGETDCILVEPDMDYFSDIGAHTILEVIPNSLGHKLTDPKTVYVLRWIAGRHAGLPEFNPPYTLE